jgi:hypothetical protein
MIEGKLVAEEERLVCHHCFDHGRHQGVGLAQHQGANQFAQIGEAGGTRDRQQTTFD